MPAINIHPDDMIWLVRLLEDGAKRHDVLNSEECNRAARLALRIARKIPGSEAKHAAAVERSRGWKRAIRAGHIRPRRTWAADRRPAEQDAADGG